jgi:hypothetical protein
MEDNNGNRFPSVHIPSSPPFNPRIYALSPRSSEPPTSPPLFSSDDAPEEADISNYESPRQKRKYAGTWWTSDIDTTPAPRKRTKLSREIGFDSGVWMNGSDDGSDEEDTLLDNDTNALFARETLDEQIKRVTKGMSEGEAALYEKVHKGIEQNEPVYILRDMRLQDFEIRHLGELNQVIQPPPDPGANVPDERAYRSMVPELYINLGSNYLAHLSPSLFSLQHLTRLVLRGNDIQELPSQIGRLESLTELDLSFNKLATLPSEILRLLAPHGKLKELHLFNNPLLQKQRDTSFLRGSVSSHIAAQPRTDSIETKAERLLEYLNTTTLPSALAAGLDESSLVPIYEAIKNCTMKLVGYCSPAHHQFPSLSALPLLGKGPSLIASTEITYYDVVGRLLLGSVLSPTSNDDSYDYIVRINSPSNLNLPASYGGPATWFEPPSRSKTASLFSLSFTKALQTESLSRVEEMLEESGDVPMQIEIYLQRAKENVQTQHEPLRTCYCCGKRFTIVRAEWVEFWRGQYDTGASVHAQNSGKEEVLPFKVQVCSWGCVPEELAAKP